jgi:hypothetical protein
LIEALARTRLHRPAERGGDAEYAPFHCFQQKVNSSGRAGGIFPDWEMLEDL